MGNLTRLVLKDLVEAEDAKSDRTKFNYWGGCGRYQEMSENLAKMLPHEGKVTMDDSPCLERLRRAINVYYDIFNNGACNRARQVKPMLTSKRHSLTKS